jgi:hypothetical protein
MEGGTFLEERIQKEFGRFVMIELHTDKGPSPYELSQASRALQRRRFGTVALPYYALLDPMGERVLWKKGGVVPADDFLAALRSVKSASSP